MHESYKKWMNEGYLKIICICGCNQEIIIKKFHIYYGVPKYINGHHMNNTHRTKETKEKIRNATLGRIVSEETKEKIRKSEMGKFVSEETKQKIKENHAHMFGENSPNWKGGSSLNQIIRDFNKYKEWRLQVFGRDNFTCQCCNARGTYLEAHHIIPFNEIIKEYNIKNIEDTINCNLLWDLNNGITYCKKCHEKLKKKGGLL